MSSKTYVVDTNVLLDDPKALFKLRNGSENRIFIPYHVILELDKLKKDPRLGHIVSNVVQSLCDYPDQFKVLKTEQVAPAFSQRVDTHILREICASDLDAPILVTNDKLLQLQAGLRGIRSESYKESAPFKSEAEHVTGFAGDPSDIFANCFMWNHQDKPVFFGNGGEKIIDYQNKVWNILPRNIYQNLALELMTDETIDIVSIQSEAGHGKSFLALAVALFLVLEKKAFEKIYVVKPMVEIGQKMGYLPGGVEEKMAPYTRYITDLVIKLHKLRPARRIFINSEENPPQFNPARFELLPLNYIRGMNLENAVVIIDEIQNMSRGECRTLLSRMGEKIKCLCLGDTRQIDHPYLTSENNGLNWVVNKFKGSRIYAHLVLKGDRSRGPITDLVIKSGL